MKGKWVLSAVLCVPLLTACAARQESAAAPAQEPSPAPAVLSASELGDVLAGLDLSDAALTCDRAVTEPCTAGLAIRAERYLEELAGFPWEECSVPDGWAEDANYYYQLAAPQATLTAFQDRYNTLHVVTDSGEGWFTLPYVEDEQVSWMICDTFERWYAEARTAALCSGTGTPLTAEELSRFQDYTASERTVYDETRDDDLLCATEISCFFTSYYEDAAELNFEEFMRYFPSDGTGGPVTAAEFEALKHVEAWPFREVDSLDSMPVPIHKYSRGTVDAALTRYAGVTTADLDRSSVAYLAEYDAYYTYTSDFGPGLFLPCYGERNGDTVTLWSAPRSDGSASVQLALQKSGENWLIRSHQPVALS